MAHFSLAQLEQLLEGFPFYASTNTLSKPAIAISACLNGERVRYDGQLKSFDSLLTLRRYLQLENICPEVAAGMPVPRPPVQLVQQQLVQQQIAQQQTIVVREVNHPHKDVTQQLQVFSEHCQHHFGSNIVAYIFKSKSPSCGLKTTPVFNVNQKRIGIESGIQASHFSRTMPHLILIDELGLKSESDCCRFIFLCFLITDLLKNFENKTVMESHQYYYFLIRLFSKDAQQKLVSLAQQSKQKQYQQVFKSTMEKFLMSTNSGELINH